MERMGLLNISEWDGYIFMQSSTVRLNRILIRILSFLLVILAIEAGFVFYTLFHYTSYRLVSIFLLLIFFSNLLAKLELWHVALTPLNKPATNESHPF